MSPRRKNPEQAIEELQAERVKIAGERHERERELTQAQAVVADFPDRHRAAVVDAARGRGDAVADVVADASRAQAVVVDRTRVIDALRTAEKEIETEQQAIEQSDEGLAFFTARRDEESEEAEQLRRAAEQACSALEQKWRAVYSRNTRLRSAWGRRGQEEQAPREVPMPTFSSPISHGLGHLGPWPGGRRPDAEEAAAA